MPKVQVQLCSLCLPSAADTTPNLQLQLLELSRPSLCEKLRLRSAGLTLSTPV
jgi:hypothetical protein